jgi:hypothetical protein
MKITNAKKVNESTIEVTIQSNVPSLARVTYDYDFLVEQREKVATETDAYVKARNNEIDEINQILAECKKLGITTKQSPSPLVDLGGV